MTVLATALLALLCVGAKPTPVVLEHSGPWDVHTSENACMLARPFGTGDARVLVAFQPLFNASTGELFVMTGKATGGQAAGLARIVHEPSGQVEKASYFSNLLPKEKKRVTRITVPRSLWDALGATDVLSITAPPIAVQVRLVRFGAARSVFENCEREILTQWHVDPLVLDPDHAPTPLRKPAFYFNSSDYPTTAMAAGHVGRVVAVLGVDAGGLVTDCRIGSSSWADLNEATCKQAKRVRFTPARDRAGKATAGVYLLPVRWSMGGM